MELDIPHVFPNSVGLPFVILLVHIQVLCNCWHYYVIKFLDLTLKIHLPVSAVFTKDTHIEMQ
jgi:hypothetical protein